MTVVSFLRIIIFAVLGIGVMTSPAWFSTLGQGGRATASPGPAFSLRSDPCERYYALTFDDGPFPGHTEDLVAALRKSRASATFFNTGAHAKEHPDLVALERTIGTVAGHSFGDDTYTTLPPTVVASDIRRTMMTLGRSARLYRPPFGVSNADVRKAMKHAGLLEVMWTVNTNDSEPPYTVEKLVEAAAAVEDGGIILLHDGWPNTVAAVPAMVNDLRARGLCPGKIVATKKPQIMQDAGDYSPYRFYAKAVKP
ncbi:MAG TPA: polysaccharide deacetylase family protein [Solirubrobacteraceae bacterium]